jgi:hypothetical protein
MPASGPTNHYHHLCPLRDQPVYQHDGNQMGNPLDVVGCVGVLPDAGDRDLARLEFSTRHQLVLNDKPYNKCQKNSIGIIK